ncbi:MAG: hypothetical protein HYU86_08790 [Chloroflexi bacterium]|nr:hypothetical protein [Chloroflexota bacterium]
MRVVAYAGSHHDVGRAHGELLQSAVEANLAHFFTAMRGLGYHQEDLRQGAVHGEGLFSPHRLEEIEGLARGAGRDFRDLLAYNIYSGWLSPEECTVMMALGETSASGQTIFLKNSDKVGSTSLVGSNYHRFKEINVVLAMQPKDGNKFVGVAAAGSTGLKLGLNDKGVATGSNIARTAELAQRRVDITQLRALDRGQLMRDGLEKDTAMEAGTLIAGKVLNNPMDTPGNVEFADAGEAVIIEGSYTRVAMEVVRNDIAHRANAFVLLKELNDPRDVSSVCRYVRCRQLLEENRGKITPEKMIQFSMDHVNGPSLNSICRHGQDPAEEVSLASGVMEIDSQHPERSRISLALGKPCHAWREMDGHVSLDMTFDPRQIPEPFATGEVWKKLYIEEPRYQ